jgi:hypothetical protein
MNTTPRASDSERSGDGEFEFLELRLFIDVDHDEPS